MNVDKKWTFLDHLPRLVNVVVNDPLLNLLHMVSIITPGGLRLPEFEIEIALVT